MKRRSSSQLCETTICSSGSVTRLSSQAGKVTVLREWLEDSHHDFAGSYFYSDSINDLALLEQVDNPITVNPDESLKTIALSRDWKIIDLG